MSHIDAGHDTVAAAIFVNHRAIIPLTTRLFFVPFHLSHHNVATFDVFAGSSCDFGAKMMLACTLLLVSCGIATAAKYDRTVVKQDDTTYWVDFFPANEKRPYRVVFFDDMGTRSKFRFNSDGLIRGIRVDQERFSVKYTSSNDLKRVETRGSRSRVLAIYEEEDEDEGEKTEEEYLTLGQREFHNHAGRRLNTCDECKATWDILCDTGM